MLKMLDRSHVSQKNQPSEVNVLGKKQKDVIEESIDYEHAMVEQSSNSLVNMAISLDPFSTVHNKIDQAVLEGQRKAIKQLMPEAFSPSPKKQHKPDYSADEFDSDSDEAKTPLDKFVVSLAP